MDEEKEIGITGTYREYEDYLYGAVHKDIETELTYWKTDLQGQLMLETDLAEIYRHQGRLQMLGEVLVLPYKIKAQIEFEQERANIRRNSDGN